jgi:hypothetical protein
MNSDEIRFNLHICDALVFSIKKTDCHNITEILLKVTLNTIALTPANICFSITSSTIGFCDMKQNTKMGRSLDNIWIKTVVSSLLNFPKRRFSYEFR